MARRDDPFDDWDWLGVFQHDSRPAEGCLRFLPTLILLTFVLSILVAPVWTAFHIGRSTFREKPWIMIGAALGVTFFILVIDLAAVSLGVFHLLTLAFSPSVQHNPLITLAMLLAMAMLVGLVSAFLVGRRELRRAQALARQAMGELIGERLARFRRGSSSPQATRR